MSRTQDLTDSLISSISNDEWVIAREVAIRGCAGRVDVLAVRRRQYLRKQLRAYEVKISRSDFLSDVGSQKWRKYLSVCHQVYFAAPSGLLKKSEIPQGAGLIVCGEKSWQVVKSAPVHEPESLDADAVLSILFSASRQFDEERARLERSVARKRRDMSEIANEIGGEVGRRLAGLTPQTEKKASRIIREVESLFGSTQDAVEALRFVAKLLPEMSMLERVGRFLMGVSGGYYSEDPSKLSRSLEFLMSQREKSPINLDSSGGSGE